MLLINIIFLVSSITQSQYTSIISNIILYYMCIEYCIYNFIILNSVSYTRINLMLCLICCVLCTYTYLYVYTYIYIYARARARARVCVCVCFYRVNHFKWYTKISEKI